MRRKAIHHSLIYAESRWPASTMGVMNESSHDSFINTHKYMSAWIRGAAKSGVWKDAWASCINFRGTFVAF